MIKLRLSASRRFKDAILSPAFVITAFAVFMFIMYSRVPLMPGDDMNFRQLSQTYEFFDFMAMRYTTWSGRVVSDALSYLFAGQLYPMWSWFLTAVTVASSFAVYKWVTFGKEFSRTRKFLLALLCCFGMGILSSNVLSPSVFWLSGSLNYFVPYALGVIAFTPFVFTIKDREYKTKKWLMVVSAACAVCSVLSQEQCAMCLGAASLVTLVYLLIRKRKPYPFLIVLTGILFVAVAIYLLCPGNAYRYNGNISTFPMLNQLSLGSRISVTAHVSFNSLINESYMPLLFLWLVIGWMLIKRADKKPVKLLGAISVAFACVIALRFISPADTNVYGIYMQAFQRLFQLPYASVGEKAALVYAFWAIGLLLIPVNLYFLWGRSRKSFFYILVFLAAIASIVVMTFTPLAYFSGARTIFLSNMLLLLLLIFQLENFEELTWLAVAVVILAILKLVLLRLLWLDHFTLWYGVLDSSSVPFKVMR